MKKLIFVAWHGRWLKWGYVRTCEELQPLFARILCQHSNQCSPHTVVKYEKKGQWLYIIAKCIYIHNFYWWYNQLHENYKRRYIVVQCAHSERKRDTSWGNKVSERERKKDEGGHSNRLTVDCMTLASWHFYAIASNLTYKNVKLNMYRVHDLSKF